jgi:hypothetical protein
MSPDQEVNPFLECSRNKKMDQRRTEVFWYWAGKILRTPVWEENEAWPAVTFQTTYPETMSEESLRIAALTDDIKRLRLDKKALPADSDLAMGGSAGSGLPPLKEDEEMGSVGTPGVGSAEATRPPFSQFAGVREPAASCGACGPHLSAPAGPPVVAASDGNSDSNNRHQADDTTHKVALG